MKQQRTDNRKQLASANRVSAAKVSFRPPLQFRRRYDVPGSSATKNPAAFKSAGFFQRRRHAVSLTSGRKQSVQVPSFATLQRAKEINDPQENTTVPDMTQNEIDAFTNSTSPQDALDGMSTIGVLQGLSGLPPLNEIGFHYVNRDDLYGEALYDESKDPKFWIDIYQKAFDSGLPVVYSTLRHELIHIAQYCKHLDKTLTTDISFDSGLENRKTYARAANAASEVETYAWEICNAPSTGVDKSYIYSRAVGLENNWFGIRVPGTSKTVNKWKRQVAPLRQEAIKRYNNIMDVTWPNHDTADTYQGELERTMRLNNSDDSQVRKKQRII